MTQTFAGLRNSIRGLAIGRKGAIQKLVTGRGGRDVGFVLERYVIEDDDIAGHFKITIRGTARDVLCAQSFIFRHINESHRKESAQLTDAVRLWGFPWNCSQIPVFCQGHLTVHPGFSAPRYTTFSEMGRIPLPPESGNRALQQLRAWARSTRDSY